MRKIELTRDDWKSLYWRLGSKAIVANDYERHMRGIVIDAAAAEMENVPLSEDVHPAETLFFWCK